MSDNKQIKNDAITRQEDDLPNGIQMFAVKRN